MVNKANFVENCIKKNKERCKLFLKIVELCLTISKNVENYRNLKKVEICRIQIQILKICLLCVMYLEIEQGAGI
jgi:hypothetical protein